MEPIPIIPLHEGYIRVVIDRKIIAIDLDTEEVEEYTRKSRSLNIDEHLRKLESA